MFVSRQGLVGLIGANGGRINLPQLDPSHKHKLVMENQYENKCCGKQVPVLIRRVKYLP